MYEGPFQAKLFNSLEQYCLPLSVIRIFGMPDSLKMVLRAKINVSELISGIGLS